MEISSYLIVAVLALTLGHYLLASMAMAVDKAYPRQRRDKGH